MKALKLLAGTLATVYTLAAVGRALERLGQGGGSYELMVGLVPVAIGAALALSAFQSALRRPEPPEAPEEGSAAGGPPEAPKSR